MTPDPTDQALAAIASIRGHGDTPDDSPSSELPPEQSASAQAATHGDLDEMFAADDIAEHDAPATAPEHAEIADVAGYTRHGPGPLDAIRFRWTARRDDDGHYFVDETIGHSRPISTGPMPADEVVAFIDGRERAARERFAALKSEMTIARRDHAAHDRHEHQTSDS